MTMNGAPSITDDPERARKRMVKSGGVGQRIASDSVERVQEIVYKPSTSGAVLRHCSSRHFAWWYDSI